MIMKKIRGFKLGGKLLKVFKWKIQPKSRSCRNGFWRSSISYNPFSKISSFARFIGGRIKGLRISNSDTGYIQLGEEGIKSVGVPKGNLAVYVGESEGNTRRMVMPVIYINHPLFEQLLKDSERVYGFNKSGGIVLPCGISEFEKVKMRIADEKHCRRKKHRRC